MNENYNEILRRKRLILKFKHWLIKKLGGYTEQQVINQRFDVHSHQFHPIVLQCDIRVDQRTLLDRMSEQNVYDNYIAHELGYKIAEQIVQKKLFTVETEDNIYSNARIYRAEIFLIHPHDAAMGSLTRREEL